MLSAIYQEDEHVEGVASGVLDGLGLALLRLDLTQTKVDVVLVPRVIKIAQKISLHSEIPVVNSSSRSTLAGCRKVRLHSGRAWVEDAHSVSVLGPLTAEDFLEGVRQLFKCRASPSPVRHAQLAQPAQKQLSGEDWLNNIGPVEAVHAVGPENAFLGVFADWSFWILVCFRDFDVKVSVVVNLMIQLVQQFR